MPEIDENELTKQDFDNVGKFASENKAYVLTIMYDDIVGSSIMVEKMGGAAFKELKKNYYNKPFMEIVTRNGRGMVIKPRGDGFMSVFAEPSTAVECALELQETFDQYGKFRVRIGIDMGQVYKEGVGVIEDLIGSHANWAARAEAMSDKGHILVTRPVYNDASAWIKKSLVSWKRHGLYRLKEGEEALELFEPYNANLITPLEKPRGTRPEDERTYCLQCGFCVKEKDTFKCRICGESGICKEYCYDSDYHRCVKCSSKLSEGNIPNDVKKLAESKNPMRLAFQVRIWSEKEGKPSRNRNINVVPKTEFSQYRLGDKIAVYFESSEDAYVYILNIGPTGDITPLLPNRFSQDNHVKAHIRYKFPDDKASFEWELQEPAGTEIVKVFATKTPMDMSRWEKMLSTRNIGIIPKASDQWAEASCVVVVRK